MIYGKVDNLKMNDLFYMDGIALRLTLTGVAAILVSLMPNFANDFNSLSTYDHHK